MPKKKRRHRTTRSDVRLGGPGPYRADREAVRIGTDLDRLALPFDAWAEEESVDQRFADLRETLQLGFGGLGALGRVDLTAWDPAHLRAMFEELLPELPMDLETRAYLAAAMDLFAEFLHSTGRWTSLDLRLFACRVVLAQVVSTAERSSALESLQDALDQEVAPATELAGLDALASVDRLGTLLQWIGSGRPVTSTGALRLADTVTAAALLGVSVRGPAAVGADQQVLDLGTDGTGGPDTPPPDDSAPRVRSMWEVAVLAPAWAALRDAGLIDVDERHVTPAPRARDWTSEDDAIRAAVRRDAAAAHLAVTLRHRAEQGWRQQQAAAAVVAALIALVSGLPVDLAHLADTVTGEVVVSDADLVGRLIETEIEDLAREGVIVLDPLRVPAALVPAVAAGLLRLVADGPDG